jgi:tRNA (guanine9-N1)-methyltransferase
LTSQLSYTYNANKKSTQPFTSLLFTGLNGRTFTRLESQSDAAYKRWKDTEWWHEGYERLWEGMKVGNTAEISEEGKRKEGNGEELEEGKRSGQRSTEVPQTASRESAVYLTADSSDELSEIKEGETYIIGGICDHNRYKVCLGSLNSCSRTNGEHRISASTGP